MGDIVGLRRGLDARGLWFGEGGQRGEERKWCFVGVLFPFSPRCSLDGWIGESLFTGAVLGGIENSAISNIPTTRFVPANIYKSNGRSNVTTKCRKERYLLWVME